MLYSLGYVNKHTPTIIKDFDDLSAIPLIEWSLSFYVLAKIVSGGQFPEVNFRRQVTRNIGNKYYGLLCNFSCVTTTPSQFFCSGSNLLNQTADRCSSSTTHGIVEAAVL